MRALFPFPTQFLAVWGQESGCRALSYVPISTWALPGSCYHILISAPLPSRVQLHSPILWLVFAPACCWRAPSWYFVLEGRGFWHPGIPVLITDFFSLSSLLISYQGLLLQPNLVQPASRCWANSSLLTDLLLMLSTTSRTSRWT